jgi:hypothetical protein
MKKILLLLTGCIFIISLPDIRAQVLVRNSSVTGVCYAGKKITRIFISPRKGIKERMGSKGGQ